jgi:hypothetical protein
MLMMPELFWNPSSYSMTNVHRINPLTCQPRRVQAPADKSLRHSSLNQRCRQRARLMK